jgi:hypothetical protein
MALSSYFRDNIDKCPATGHFKPELFSIMLHKFFLATLGYCVLLKDGLKYIVKENIIIPFTD